MAEHLEDPLDEVIVLFDKYLTDFYDYVTEVYITEEKTRNNGVKTVVTEKGGNNPTEPVRGYISNPTYREFMTFKAIVNKGNMNSVQIAEIFSHYCLKIRQSALGNAMRTDWMTDTKVPFRCEVKGKSFQYNLYIGAFYDKVKKIDEYWIENDEIISSDNHELVKPNFVRNFYRVLLYSCKILVLSGRKQNGEVVPYTKDDHNFSPWEIKLSRFTEIIKTIDNIIEGNISSDDFLTTLIDRVSGSMGSGERINAREILKNLKGSVDAEGLSKVLEIVPELFSGKLSQKDVMEKLKKNPIIRNMGGDPEMLDRIIGAAGSFGTTTPDGNVKPYTVPENEEDLFASFMAPPKKKGGRK